MIWSILQSQDGSISGRSSNADTSPNTDLKSDPVPIKEKKEGRSRKKTSWFNFYPTYKSKSEDLKTIFKDVPNEERLVVGKLIKNVMQCITLLIYY